MKTLSRFLITLTILLVVISLFLLTVLPMLKKKVASVAAQKTVETVVKQVSASEGLSIEDREVRELYESLPEEDKEAVEEIIADHMDAQTISEVTTYITNRDSRGLKEYAAETLTPEEMDRLLELYDRYKDQINE